MLGIFANNETSIEAKTGHSYAYESSCLKKTKVKKTKYKNGKIKTKTTYYKNKKNCMKADVKIYRKYNKKSQEYYAKVTEIVPFSKKIKSKIVTTYSKYKKNGKKLGYTKVNTKSYEMYKKSKKWKYKKVAFSIIQTTSKGKANKASTIYYNNKGKIGKGAYKFIIDYHNHL